ncbi:MAG: SDR family oxidoreductase [Chloroflexi bacterium]|nr:SDR family oxidoreductase [Chloroflexota bacterium]
MIVGATGMLGHVLFDLARRVPDLDVYATVRKRDERTLTFLNAEPGRVFECDLAAIEQIDPALYCAPDMVVNCAGIVRHLGHIYSPADFIKVNALAPHILTEGCDRRGARLIQLSSVCVFSGRKGNYCEDDLPDPTDLYSRTKLLGELYQSPHLTLRTSFIGRESFRERGYLLLDWFLSRAGDVPGFTDARWSGLTTLALSRIILEMIRTPEVTGLLHVCGETVSKYDLLCLAQSVFAKTDVVIRPDGTYHCDRSMQSTRLAGLGIQVPPMKQMLVELRDYYSALPAPR